ncbi:MAG TPA: ABC transporter substrate-binding protein [Nitriliruptorales bacterium]|nr:ABC transporter substrate-binding protein [Nitriliruptorales bacterium]
MPAASSPPRATRHQPSWLRGLGVLAVLTSLLVACGQKPGVHVAAEPGVVAGGTGPGVGVVGGATGVPPAVTGGDLAGDLPTSDAATGAGGTGVDEATGGGADAVGAARQPAQPAQQPAEPAGQPAQQPQPPPAGGNAPRGRDRTGVSEGEIRIALHAPQTGAAPLPTKSFEQSRDLYWRWLTEQQGGEVLGRRKVVVTFADDKYQPSSASQVCRQLMEGHFLLLGGGGTDQIQACGRLASARNVPYLSAGVTEAGLQGLPWYFAASMSYRAQGRLLAQFVKRNFGDAKVAMIVTDTPNFDDAVQGWEAAVREVGINYYKTQKHPRGDTSWYATYGDDMASNGVQVLYVLSSPLDYIRFAQQNDDAGFRYVGVGITMGLNAVLANGCPQVHGGVFFSPFPGLDWARQHEPAFFQAAGTFGTPDDDLSLAMWGLAKQLHVMFERYRGVHGNELTREDFRAVVEQQRGLETGLFPTLNYSPQDHFGASTVHVLQANCDAGEHTTLATFVSGF